MKEKKSFRVVIAGGSITGLTVANMLQLYDIDYVLLEAYPEIAPQVGASIGLLPHGNRILDQLGVYEKILSFTPPVDSFWFRKSNGELVVNHLGMNASFIERHGYPILFLDRQTVIQVLYDNLKDKSKVLTGHSVDKVEVDDEGVTVRTKNGKVFQGDILIGADGIHSVVREQMWKIADKMAPGTIPLEEANEVPADYGCIFGISNPCKGVDPGMLNSIFREKDSYILNGGPAGRVYWFYFYKYPKTLYGSEIPRYTKEDEAKLIAQRGDDDLVPGLKFSELCEKKISSTLTPLIEYVYKHWHFHRIITIGDAAHKFHPIAGHGGNACIESAATLVNALRAELNKSPTGKLTTDGIEKIFAHTQKVRRDRVITLKCQSHEQQRTESLDTWFHKLAALYLLPHVDVEDVTFNFSRNLPLAERLHSVKLPPRPKLIPYKDELVSDPKTRGIYQWILIAFYLAMAALVHYGMWIRPASYGLEDQFGSIITTGTWSYDPSFPLKRTYIGIRPIDNYLTFLSAAYMPGINNWDKNFGMLQMYFLGMLVQPIAIWAIESCRKRNAMTLVSAVTIWFTLVQWAGVGIYMPIYYAGYTLISNVETYWWPLNREVPIHYAASLLWAIMLGYALPTMLMFVPWKNANTIQTFEALWQPSPMFVPALCLLGAFIYNRRYPTTGQHAFHKATEQFLDVPKLRTIYVVTGLLGVALHWYVITRIVSSHDTTLTLSSVFWPDWSATPKALGEGIRALFLADFWGFYIASYVWCVAAVWDLKRVGRATVDLGKAAAAILLANLVIGPGAAMSAVWYWRENAMAKTSFDKGIIP